MKHKKDTSNVKSVNKPSKSPAPQNDAQKIVKTSDNHQDIVKRLMTHSQYFPTNPSSKPVEVSYGAPTYLSYPMPPQYPAYHPPPTYNSNDIYPKDFYYQAPQPSYNQYPTITPPLSSPSTHNFDQISNGSPRNDYIFNGEFTLNFNTDFDGSFPLIDCAKTPQLFDNHGMNQAPLEMKPFDVVSRNGGQLTPVTIESLHHDGEIKNSFDARSNVLVNLSDDDVLSNASYLSRSPPSATVDWKFTEHQ
jgi:hypothetical protein